MKFLPIGPENREKVNEFIARHWLSTDILIRGEIFDSTTCEGFLLENEESKKIVALITYDIRPTECEIVTLNSLIEGIGIAAKLIDRVAGIARAHGCQRLVVMTTNDNMKSISFYQRNGFDMVKIYRNSINENRYLKPSIPKISRFTGIPMSHEIEFEMIL
ncbi:MAG: GNAT family N-acetyltransferase [Ruminococcaceae bacterium]|nr:GNAT family N-acetyltransferase [Oscillospiraceae bacterium]